MATTGGYMTSAEENSPKLVPCADGLPRAEAEIPPTAPPLNGHAGGDGQAAASSEAGQEAGKQEVGKTAEIDAADLGDVACPANPGSSDGSKPLNGAPRTGSTPSSGSSRPGDATFVSQSPPYSAAAAAIQPDSASLVGQKLDHFEILELIGGGGMGLVFRAHDTALDRIVAVKILSTNRAADEETIRRFRNEAQSAARLDHENIARVYYVGEARGLNYIVLEYIDGVNLRDLVASQGSLAVDQVLGYALQLAQALDHASSRNIVHRDIKPSNVLVTHEGRTKLVDMGLSRLQEPGSDEDLTASGVTLGTFDYISPEQARDPRNADVRSDIYSLGCTLHYLLTGQPPFPSGNAMQKLLQHQGDEPPDLMRLNPTVPEGLSRIVRKMLAKDPRRRYQDARSLIVDLSLLCAQLGIDFPSAGITLLMPVVPRWRQVTDRLVPWLVPAAALLVTVVVLDRIWVSRFGAFEAFAPPVRNGADAGNVRASENPADPPKDNGGGKQPSPAVSGAQEVIEPLTAPPVEDRSPRDPSGTWLALGGGSGLKVRGGAELTPDQVSPSSTHLAASEAAKLSALPSPVAPAPNVLVVDPAADGSRPYEFATLKAAVEKIKGGGTIELRYTGRSPEQPFKLPKLGNVVTIRAAEGHQPVMVFAPETSSETQQMISLRDTQLKLINVALELTSPSSSREGRWALVSLVRSSIELQRCTLTSIGYSEFPDKVCFFQAEGDNPSGAMMMAMEMPGGESSVPSIQLNDCVARGGGEFVHAKVPVRVRWGNGLAVLSDPLFVSETSMPPRGSNSWIELSHVTARLNKGLCSLAGSAVQETSVSCQNCILVGAGEAPFIQQQGSDTVANLKNRFTWQGGSNLYEAFPTRWRITGEVGQESMDESQWRLHWNSGESPAAHDHGKPLGWVRPNRSSTWQEHVPSDYELRSDSQATKKAHDVGDIGFRLDDLPKPPPAHRADAPSSAAPVKEDSKISP